MSDRIATLPNFSTITPEEIAAAAFLSRYRGETRKLYTSDLRIYFAWCARHELRPLEVERAHVEFFARYLEEERRNMPASRRSPAEHPPGVLPDRGRRWSGRP